ncbi:probable RNA-directed DNA polymerase from transposon BS [Trichonephila clavipes]|nr:probable RNA-directed DNA polymerase from transposon BS [Trichonephila clavipes]
MEMDNRNEPTDMDLIDSPRRTPTPPPLSACEQILQNKAQLQKMETFKKFKLACIAELQAMPDHHPDEPFYRRAVSELQEVEETINLAVSDLASFPPCVSPGCPHHDSGLKIITPKNSPDVTPTKRVLNLNSNRISNKRKEESDFEYPPLRKTTKRQILNIPNDSISISPNKFSLPSDSNIEEITGSQNAIPVVTPKPPTATGPTPSGNQNPGSTLPPPVMLRITETVRSQMKIINEKFPKIRSRTTGEFIKLYTDNLEQFHELLTFAEKTKFQFYEIKPKNERPIKVVLKGLPRNFKVEEIQADLEELGFTPEKVNQLIGRRSKQPIPVFLVTLPRSIENLKIFHLKTLSYLSIRVEGYNGKGVTQCYTCNHFHHNSENCHLNPRCLKCGEGHITRECPITERLETAYCINCEMYGHMANWRGCPCFPKPPKGTALNNRNSYTNIYNSIIRPNVSYAQAANPNKISTNFNSQNKQPMAPKGPVNSAQIEANRNPSANNRSIPNFNNNQPQKELKIYSNDTWNARLEALNTTDNSLWEAQRFLKNKRSQIPTLNCATGMAVTDPQKANLLANTIKNNFIENNRMQDNYDQDDEVVTSTVNTFLSPPSTQIEPAMPDEIINFIKNTSSKKAPGKDTITNKMLKNFPIKLILILTILVNKILKFHHFPSNWKEAIIFPIIKPGTNKNLPNSYRPISLLSTLSKLTEYIILNRLKKFINDNSLINPNQYGFTNKLSTLHPLLRLTESISEGFQKEEHGSGLSGYPESLRPCLDFRTHFQTNYLRYSFSPHSPHPLVSH